MDVKIILDSRFRGNDVAKGPSACFILHFKWLPEKCCCSIIKMGIKRMIL